ncbi:MAG: helix-turn-helix domain-containing protein [Actinobacteria bacterium]|nr:helix-turn-helix domain-containing protein [Actinomycetota bacterium]
MLMPGATAVDRGQTNAPRAPTVLRVLLGAQLRKLRESRGVSASAAAQAIRASESKISRIELGRHGVREVDVADLLDLYGVTDGAVREQFLSTAAQASQLGWWHHYQDVIPSWFTCYLGLEESADLIRSFDAQFVPGLLQTQEYSRAVLQLGAHAPDDVPRLVRLRQQRQEQRAASRHLWTAIDETALHRPVGSPEVMRGQLEHLLDVAGRPGVTIQVTPFRTGAYYAAPASFSILHFASEDLPDVVYVEQLTSALYLDKRADVYRYAQAMDQISATSTQPEESVALIRTALTRLPGSQTAQRAAG